MVGFLGAIRNKLRRDKAAREFAKLVKPFDERIAAARAKHQPVRAIQAEKRRFVELKLRAELGR